MQCNLDWLWCAPPPWPNTHYPFVDFITVVSNGVTLKITTATYSITDTPMRGPTTTTKLSSSLTITANTKSLATQQIPHPFTVTAHFGTGTNIYTVCATYATSGTAVDDECDYDCGHGDGVDILRRYDGIRNLGTAGVFDSAFSADANRGGALPWERGLSGMRRFDVRREIGKRGVVRL